MEINPTDSDILAEYLIPMKERALEEGFDEELNKLIVKCKGKKFDKTIHFTGNFEFGIEFENCEFNRSIRFYEAKFKSKVTFKDCLCKGEVSIDSQVEFENEFDIITFSVVRQFLINDGIYNQVRLSLVNDSILKVNGGEFKALKIGFWGGASFKEILIDFKNTKGHISVSGQQTKVKNLLLSQYALESSISIEDIQVNYLSVYRFRNEKGFRILNVRAFADETPSEFSIIESYLGKGEFYSVDFKSFDKFYVYNSHLTDCSFINVVWNLNIKALKGRRIGRSKEEEIQFNIIEKEENPLNKKLYLRTYYENLRDVFKQIKFALGKQGDVLNEQKFHSCEMNTHNKSLPWKSNFWTKSVIYFSNWFSSFGQSLWKPLLALLIGHWVFFMLLIYFNGIDNLSISFCQANKEGFKVGFYNYFKLINPLRKGEDITGCNIILDIIIRIWASYMIYNIIRATRRFIK